MSISREQSFVNDLFTGLGAPEPIVTIPAESSPKTDTPLSENGGEKKKTLGEEAIEWIENEFYIPELRAPIVLYPYQKAVLKEAYRTDENGKFVYSLVIWSDIKKSAKSTIAAAVCLERARRTPWGSFKIAANSKEQADSRVSFYLRRAVALNPKLSQSIRTKLYNVMLPNNSFIQSVPLNAKTVAGGNDDMVSFSELWAADNQAAEECWTELTLSPTKYGESQRWIDTYAGYHDVSLLLENLYNQGKEGYLVETEIPGLELYANPQAQMLMLWNTQPRLPWQTPQYYAQEAAALSEMQFNRIHRNQWATSVSQFIRPEWWEACRQETVPPLDKYDMLVIAADAAVKGDSFAIIAVSKKDKLVIPRYLKVWYPPKHGKIVFRNKDNPDDPEYPEGYIRSLIANNNVLMVTYDPYQLHSMMTDLANENLSWFEEFGQVKMRLESDKQLYDFIRERRIVNPGFEDLTKHLMDADAELQGERHMRIIKRSDSSHVDAAVALSMAAYMACLNIPD